MVFKKLPYWFKFGFVFSIIFLIIYFVFGFSINRLFSGESFLGFVFLILYFLPSMLLPSNFVTSPIFGLMALITIFFVYFILGMIIGSIIQKIKNKTETTKVNKFGIKCVIYLIVFYIIFIISVYYLQAPKNEEDCGALPDAPYEYNKDFDRNWCFGRLAEKKLDPNICGKVTVLRHYCFRDVAIESQEYEDICEKVIENSLKQECLQLFNDTVNVEEQISQ